MRVGRRRTSYRVVLAEPLELRRLFADIALFNNDIDFDKDDDLTLAGNDASFNVLRSALEDTLDHDIDSFDVYDPVDMRAELEGADLIVIPELVDSRVLTDRPLEAESLIRDFVTNGGGLISVGGARGINARFLENIFGYSQVVTTHAPDIATRTPQAVGTPFADSTQPVLPATPDLTPIFFFDNRPINASSPETIYATETDQAAVAKLPFAGRSDVVYIGASFGTFTTTTQEANWTDVIAAAVIDVDEPDVPDDQLAPSNVVADALGSPNSVTVTWTDNTTAERLYEVQVAPGQFGPFTQTLTLPPNTTSAVVPDLDQNRNYFFRVAAVGAGAAPRYAPVVSTKTASAGTPAPAPTPSPTPTDTPLPAPSPTPTDPVGEGPLIDINPTALVAGKTSVRRGNRLTATLHVTNQGDFHYRGELTIVLKASPVDENGNDIAAAEDALLLTKVVRKYSLKAGVTKRLKLKFQVPEGREDIQRFRLVAELTPSPVPNYALSGGTITDAQIVTVFDDNSNPAAKRRRT